MPWEDNDVYNAYLVNKALQKSINYENKNKNLQKPKIQ